LDKPPTPKLLRLCGFPRLSTQSRPTKTKRRRLLRAADVFFVPAPRSVLRAPRSLTRARARARARPVSLLRRRGGGRRLRAGAVVDDRELDAAVADASACRLVRVDRLRDTEALRLEAGLLDTAIEQRLHDRCCAVLRQLHVSVGITLGAGVAIDRDELH